jgi:hypothetical protein
MYSTCVQIRKYKEEVEKRREELRLDLTERVGGQYSWKHLRKHSA